MARKLLFQFRLTWILERKGISCNLADETKCRLNRADVPVYLYLWTLFGVQKVNVGSHTSIKNKSDPKVTWTRSLMIWSRTHHHSATETVGEELIEVCLKNFQNLFFGKLLTSKSAMHSSAAGRKAGNQMHIAVTPEAQWSRELD